MREEKEMHDVHVLDDSVDRRAAFEVFLAALCKAPVTDYEWLTHGHSEEECWLGVKSAHGEIVGAAYSFPTRLTLPGGARVRAAAVTGVGVRADATRAGRLTALMRSQLSSARERGDAVAVLHATQTGLYDRFGYGIASRTESVQIAANSDWRATASSAGQVRMLSRTEAAALLPYLQEQLAGARPGGMTRTSCWWRRALNPASPSAPGFTGSGHQGIAVHTGLDADDGFVVWNASAASPGHDWPTEIIIQQLWARSGAAAAGLWRFLSNLDLVDSVVGWSRPLDENLDLMLVDPRHHRITGRGDDLWLRIIDLSVALTSRSWGSGDPITLRIHDPFPIGTDESISTWRISSGNVNPSRGTLPDLECNISSLAPAFLGDRRPSELVTSGLWTEHTAGAAIRADALFSVPGSAPWSGTWF